MYCKSNKSLIEWNPGVEDILAGRGYIAQAVDTTMDDIMLPEPTNDELEDLVGLALAHRKEDEVFTITMDAGDVESGDSSIYVAREGKENNIIYRVKAFIYYYFEQIYKRLRAWISFGRLEEEDIMEPCSLYIYPGWLKPRRGRNTRHRNVKLTKTGGYRFYIRDYRKRWVPGVPQDE